MAFSPVLSFLGKIPMRLSCLAINAITAADVNASIGSAEVSIHSVTCEDRVIHKQYIVIYPACVNQINKNINKKQNKKTKKEKKRERKTKYFK